MAHAHMNDSHAGSSDLGCTGSKLDSAQKARRDSTIRGKFLQTVTSRTDTKRVVVIVLSAIVPTFFYASASARAHERLARQQLRVMSREKHIWLVRPVRTLSLRVFLRLGPRISTRHETGGCDRIKRDPPAFQSLPRVAHAHTRLARRQLRSRLHEQHV